MLSPTLDTVRLSVHVLAATVWVGGQIVLAGLVPSLRHTFPGATTVTARAYARIAWPAYAVLVVSGLWNIAAIDVTDTTTEYQVTLLVKIALAVVSGAAAAVHQLGRSKLALALGGSVGLLGALGALFFGLVLRTGS
jgi:putative copper export protein